MKCALKTDSVTEADAGPAESGTSITGVVYRREDDCMQITCKCTYANHMQIDTGTASRPAERAWAQGSLARAPRGDRDLR